MSAFRWENAVVYEVYIRSFFDSDGDGVGDLNGICQKLPYIRALGADALWITPFFQSPGVDNGYDISDYRRIEAQYGTQEDFRALVEEAHVLGLRVILDMVLNHSSSEHPWFIESRSSRSSEKRDWYFWSKEPNNWGGQFGGSAWHYDEQSGEYYLGLFSAAQPDLNWRNPQVREAMKDVLRFWAGEGADGFRLDSIGLLSKPEFPADGEVNRGGYADFHDAVANDAAVHDYLRELHRDVFGPLGLVTIGETPSVTVDDALAYCSPEREELDMAFQFEHVGLDGSEGYKWTSRRIDREELKRVLIRWQLGLQDRANGTLFWCNHDQPRIVSRIGDTGPLRERSAKMLAALLYLMRGTAFVYQGQELAMTGGDFRRREDLRDIEALNGYDSLLEGGLSPEQAMEIVAFKTRDNARTPMQWNDGPNAGFSAARPWIAPGKDFRQIHVSEQEGRSDSVLNFYRELLALRKTEPCCADGRFVALRDTEGVLAYERRTEENGLLVVCNMSDGPRCFSVPAGYRGGEVILGNVPDSVFGKTGELAAYECTVIRRRGIPQAVLENRKDQARREEERMKNGRSALFAEGLCERYDLPYRDDGDPRHMLDLIRPEGEGVLPVIVEIHGGAYIACEKNINRLHARWFARQGFAVVNGDYTLHPEGTFRQNLQELADLFSWIGLNAARYGLDTEHVYLSGDSAGGHLVLLYAMLQGSAEMQECFGVRPSSVRVRAAAPTCPAFRLRYESDHPKREELSGLTALVFPDGATDEAIDELDVLKWLPGSAYPPLIVTATPSDDILYEEDLILGKALEAVGRPYSLRIWEEKRNKLGHVFNVLFPELEESEAANRAIADFFRTQG